MSRADGGLGIGLIIFNDQFDGSVQDTTGSVDLVDNRLHRLQHTGAILGAGTGKRRQHAKFYGGFSSQDCRCK